LPNKYMPKTVGRREKNKKIGKCLENGGAKKKGIAEEWGGKFRREYRTGEIKGDAIASKTRGGGVNRGGHYYSSFQSGEASGGGQ